MDRDDENERALATEVAATRWGRFAPLSLIQGEARQTWRVGTDLWLTAMDGAQTEKLRREHRLLFELLDRRAGREITFAVPIPVPTTEGAYEVEHATRVWRATTDLPGSRPNDEIVDTFLRAAEALAELHRVLRELTTDYAVATSLIAGLRPMLELAFSGDWSPRTDDKSESELVVNVAEWLMPHLARLEGEPTQLIHGDYATPNLLVDAQIQGRVTAVLDWEFSAVGPAISDLATLVSTVLMWSHIPKKHEVIEALLDVYGGGINRALLGPAIAAKWYCNYWWARRDLERTGWTASRAAMNRQPSRLKSVLEYVTSIS